VRSRRIGFVAAAASGEAASVRSRIESLFDALSPALAPCPSSSLVASQPSSSSLARSSAAVASLLLVVLIWPFIQLVDALSMILDTGMTWDLSTSSPLMSLIFASIISLMVWAVAIFIPDA